MNVLVVGAHGQVGQHVTKLLAEGEHEVRGMVRDEAQVADIEALGAKTVIADLTDDVSHAVRDTDAIVFAAGSGGENVTGVDRDGAIETIEAAERFGAERFVMLSAINADTPEESPDALREYLAAKAVADERLRESELRYTIVRPGALTDEAATGRVEIGRSVDRGEIPRADVARTLVTALDMDETHEKTFELVGGETAIEDALQSLSA